MSEFTEVLVSSVEDVITGALEGRRSVNMGAIEVNGKYVKLTFCAEPTIFGKTEYANYPSDGKKPKKVVCQDGDSRSEGHQTTSVIEQLRSFENL